MKPSEKLIIMLELNNYNVDNLFQKKFVEVEKSSNFDLNNCDTYSDLVISSYLDDNKIDYTSRNPFSYKDGMWKEVESLDQLTIKHPDVGKKLSIKEFLSIEIFSESEKKKILNDVVDTWIDEYKEAKTKSLKHLQEQFFSITKDNNNYYTKPRKFSYIFVLLLALFFTMVYLRPNILIFDFIPSFGTYITDWNVLMHDTLLYTALGGIILLLIVLYIYQVNSLTRRIRGVVREKKSKNIKSIYKWESGIEKTMIKQFKKIKKYIVLVLKKPDKSRFELKKITDTQTLFDKYRSHVEKVEKKYKWMNKNHAVKTKRIRLTYVTLLFFDFVFIGLAFAIIRGLINV